MYLVRLEVVRCRRKLGKVYKRLGELLEILYISTQEMFTDRIQGFG